MSWVDLAALTLMLWGAAQGYIHGMFPALFRFSGAVFSVVIAIFFAEPLAVFMQNEWQLEAVFVDWYHYKGQPLLAVTQSGSNSLILPPLAAPVLRQLSPQLTTAPVIVSPESLLPLLAALALRVLTFTLSLLFLLTLLRICAQLRTGERSSQQPEWQRLVGLVVGSAYGLLSAQLICLALDAFSLIFKPTLLQADLAHSYLAQVVTFIFKITGY